MTVDRYLTPERLALRDEARRFAMDEVLPLADELDPRHEDIPRWFLDRIGEQGYFGITVPREAGGMGLGVFEYCLVAEELARAWMSVASIIARAQGMGTQVGDPERQRELLARSARGQWIGAAALSEPGAGSDLANVQCRAERDGDGWVVTGEKRWCGNALAADFINLLARVRDPAPGEPRAVGLATFVVEKERGAFPPGLTGEPIDKIGYFGMTTWNLRFDGLRVPDSHRVGGGRPAGATGGAAGAGDDAKATFRATQAGLNVARVHTAARAVGLARGALEDSLAYARQRVQFERPIASFQAIRFKVADMATGVEAGRALYHQVAQAMDDGEPVEREAAMAKLLASEMAVRVTGEAMQIHGGNGYTTERRVERYWRDARLTTIFEGTSEIQRRTISDRLLGRAT
ncbi:MAG TPA: acyl-CoA dehydrogenase family protein [Acidimicrobiales bacterium]|nr:acyl-CoA dehydrogenase family protein [Acidimicrobiales bacterium]